jgi:hypothetical protein
MDGSIFSLRFEINVCVPLATLSLWTDGNGVVVDLHLSLNRFTPSHRTNCDRVFAGLHFRMGVCAQPAASSLGADGNGVVVDLQLSLNRVAPLRRTICGRVLVDLHLRIDT